MTGTSLDPFFHHVFLAFVALFPPVNPIGSALIVQPYLSVLSERERRDAAARIALYCFSICVCSALFGGVFFKFFGISIPVVQMAGGVLICRMGWNILSSPSTSEDDKSMPTGAYSKDRVQSMLFFPIAFPVTAGTGTISVLLTLSANGYDAHFPAHALNLSAIIFSSILICGLIFFAYAFASQILSRLSKQGQQILNKLSGFLNFCVGLQIAVNGVTSLVHSF